MPSLVTLGLAAALLQAAPSPTGATLSGRVLEEGTQKTIAGAEVTLMPTRPSPHPRGIPANDPSITTVTDHTGRYVFSGLVPGDYHITVRKAGFALTIGPDLPGVTLYPGDRRTADLTLQRGAVMVGRVLDESGEPLVEVSVMAMRELPAGRGPNGSMHPFVPFGTSAQTNDLGEFRLYGLPPGQYYVYATPRHPPPFLSAAQGRTMTMLPTYYPGTADRAAAHPITLAGGQTANDVVVRMVTAAAYQVSGIVRDQAGRPVEHAMVRLTADDAQGARGPMMFGFNVMHASRTDAGGRFTIGNVTSGAYSLVVAPPILLAGPPSGLSGGGQAIAVAGGVQSGSNGLQVLTESRGDGTTIQYRDETATTLRITVEHASVSGLEVTVQRPQR